MTQSQAATARPYSERFVSDSETTVTLHEIDIADTPASRALIAAGIGLSTALPDFVKSNVGRFAANHAIFGGVLAATWWVNSRDDNPDNDVDAALGRLKESFDGPEHQDLDDPENPPAGPVKTWGLIGAAEAGLFALMWANYATNKLVTVPLQKLGVKRPNTLLGLAGAGLSYWALSRENSAKGAR